MERVTISRALLDELWKVIANAPNTGLTFQQTANLMQAVNTDLKPVEPLSPAEQLKEDPKKK